MSVEFKLVEEAPPSIGRPSVSWGKESVTEGNMPLSAYPIVMAFSDTAFGANGRASATAGVIRDAGAMAVVSVSVCVRETNGFDVPGETTGSESIADFEMKLPEIWPLDVSACLDNRDADEGGITDTELASGGKLGSFAWSSAGLVFEMDKSTFVEDALIGAAFASNLEGTYIGSVMLRPSSVIPVS